jgi:hypothetical protein
MTDKKTDTKSIWCVDCKKIIKFACRFCDSDDWSYSRVAYINGPIKGRENDKSLYNCHICVCQSCSKSIEGFLVGKFSVFKAEWQCFKNRSGWEKCKSPNIFEMVKLLKGVDLRPKTEPPPVPPTPPIVLSSVAK